MLDRQKEREALPPVEEGPRRPDRPPPPDHEEFLAFQAAGFRSLRARLEKRRKKKS